MIERNLCRDRQWLPFLRSFKTKELRLSVCIVLLESVSQKTQMCPHCEFRGSSKTNRREKTFLEDFIQQEIRLVLKYIGLPSTGRECLEMTQRLPGQHRLNSSWGLYSSWLELFRYRRHWRMGLKWFLEERRTPEGNVQEQEKKEFYCAIALRLVVRGLSGKQSRWSHSQLDCTTCKVGWSV